MLPGLVGPYGVLPVGVHRATMAEVKDLFVDRAPEDTRRRRRWIFEALELHVSVVRKALRGEEVTVWVDGGFVTHKPWTPEDVDVLYLTTFDGLTNCGGESDLPLWTLSKVRAEFGPRQVQTGKLHPMAGLLDGYADKDNGANRERWNRRFSRFKRQDGTADPVVTKGFLEVILDD